jgi:heavy metal sensor kinase
MTLPLRARLTIVYTAIFGVLLTAISLISYRVLARQLDADATARLTELTEGLHGYLHFVDGTPTILFDPNDADQAAFVEEATRYYQVYDVNSGSLVVQSKAVEPFGLRFTPAEVREFGEQPGARDIATDYGRIRISSSVIAPVPGERYLMQVGLSLAPMDGALRRFLEMLMWSVPVGLIAAVFAGGWMAGLGLAPLVRFAAAAQTIDVTNLRQRLPVRGTGDELDEVAVAFNETLARLERAVEEMRQFSAALAHELRTPLAALRGEIEMSLLRRRSPEEDAKGFGSQLEELDKLKRLIDQILTLARAEAGQIPLKRDRVELSALCSTLVDQLEPVAQAKTIDLRCETSGATFVEGDPEWLERLVLNLVDNAVKFTPPGGQVTVRVAAAPDGAAVEIADTGPGIDEHVLPRIFEPFYRGDPARSSAAAGVGVGLTLVKWVVDRHKGRIGVRSRSGHGSTFEIWLPAAQGVH